MTEWKLISPNEQEDEVGNIFQKGGAVIPKACQKCKKEFSSIPTKEELKEEIPEYKCFSCSFKSSTGEKAFDHTLDFPTHKIGKQKQIRIIGYNVVLKGSNPQITISDDDVIILCEKCNGI